MALEMPYYEPWTADARCSRVGGDLWFPEKGEPTRDAKKVCLDCPVQFECLDYALRNNERFGVWGGKSERERRKLAGKEHPSERAA